MAINGVRLADPTQQIQKPEYVRAYAAQEEPVKTGTANFEGRKDADTFEKTGMSTGAKVAVGTGIAAAILYGVTAYLGKKGIKFKDPNNFFTRGINTTLEKAYESAHCIKENTWGRIANLFNKGDKGGTPAA